jgi:hypothetical protein
MSCVWQLMPQCWILIFFPQIIENEIASIHVQRKTKNNETIDQAVHMCQYKATKLIRTHKQEKIKNKLKLQNHSWLVHLTYGFVSLLSIGDIHCRASGSKKPCIASDGNDSIKLSCKSYVKNTYIKYSTLFATWNHV